MARDPDRKPSHPGALLRDVVSPSLGLPRGEVARALGVSRRTLHAIRTEKQAVTPEIAARVVGKALGNVPGVWLRMQAAVDTWRAERIDASGVRALDGA